jgi:subtilisin family serine protease
MRWSFEEPRRDKGGAGPLADDYGPALISLPAAVLERHGARLLSAAAAELPDSPAPRPTVYRARTLLIPADLLRDPVIGAIRRALARVGLTLRVPEVDTGRGRPGQGRAAELLRRLPRTVVLAPAASAGDKAPVPVVVDAWVALQAVRAAARPGQALDPAAARRISLEHLLVSGSINGSPIWNSSGVAGSPIWNSSGVTGPGSTGSYLFSGGDARTPVALCLDPPDRGELAYCNDTYGRRPVVAILDTGVRTHPWLGVTADRQAPGGYVTAADGSVTVDEALQQAIYAESQAAASAGDRPRQLIRYPWDTPVTNDPLVGEIETDLGHGTFIAGIVRQVAPSAQVLSIRITHSDGMVYEGDLTCALGQLIAQIAAAQENGRAAGVDVLSLSLGYFSETEADQAYSSGLWAALEALLQMGVLVVAAAGNFSTRRRFYPAAFAERPAQGAAAPLISVGAYNPNGSRALFSDDGCWVKAWATGAAIISTYPTDINASREPEVEVRARSAASGPPTSGPPGVPAGGAVSRRREALDPDDFTSGFTVWSGTSFSAPLLAALTCARLMTGAEADKGLHLDKAGAAAAITRVTRALASLGWQPS